MEECKEECEHGAWLSGLLDEELTEEQQCQLRQHLEKCAPCRKLLQELKTVEQCLCGVAAPCPVVWEALWQAVAQELPSACKVRSRWPASVLDRLSDVRRWRKVCRPRWAVAVAAGVLALLVGVWALESIRPDGKSGPLGPGPSPRGSGAIALAPADTLDVEIDQSEGEPGALLLVSADGTAAVVWVTGDEPVRTAPDI